MTALEYILDGLAAELELERELGVRTIEIDRSLLAAVPPVPVTSSVSRLPSSSPVRTEDVRHEMRRETPVAAPPIPLSPQAGSSELSLAFLHDRPLAPQGVEMMAKILTAMGLSTETTPIVVAPPVPPAKIYVVLGGFAMKKYFPGMRGGPGQWQKTSDGRDVLITYSPAYILRFATVTPVVKKMKQDMWRSLKAVVQRLGQS